MWLLYRPDQISNLFCTSIQWRNSVPSLLMLMLMLVLVLVLMLTRTSVSRPGDERDRELQEPGPSLGTH